MTDAPASANLLPTKTLPAEPTVQADKDLTKPRRWRLRLRRWWLVPLATLPLAIAVGMRQLNQPPLRQRWRRRCPWRL